MLNPNDVKRDYEDITQKIIIDMNNLPYLTNVVVKKGFCGEFDILPLIKKEEAEQHHQRTLHKIARDSQWRCEVECLITDQWGQSYIWKKGALLKFLEIDTTKACRKVRLYEDCLVSDVFIDEQEYWYSMPLEQFKLVARKV